MARGYIATIVKGRTVVGAFASMAAARAAMRELDRRGFAPDRVGVVRGDPREAREPAGSYSPQGAIAGALLAVVFVMALVVLGPPWMREPVAVVLGTIGLVVGLTAIGWLAGRARLFKADEYDDLEDEVEAGATLISVVADTHDGVDAAKAALERMGATDVRIEDTAESV